MDVIVLLVSALVSAGMSAGMGLVMRLAIERKYNEARQEAERRRERRLRIAGLRQDWQQAAGRVFYHLVRCAQGRPANGDLAEAFRRLEDVEADMKQMESALAAEAQED